MEISQAFRAKAHLLKLLGDELIGDDRLAVFELIKNAYDSDATQVDVSLKIMAENPFIKIKDNGCGMSQHTIVNKWLEIGTDSKRGENRNRTETFKRMPLGEKGVGRLAVHKLGSRMYLHTRAKGHPEYRIKINWTNMINSSNYLEDTNVRIKELSEPKYFNGNKTGTCISIYGLHTKEWSTGQLRSLKKLVTSLVSPFQEVSGFDVDLNVPGREPEIRDVLDIGDILDRSIWTYNFALDEHANFEWEYEYKPPSAFKTLKSNEKSGEGLLALSTTIKKEDYPGRIDFSKNMAVTAEDLEGIGPITGSFYVYFRRNEVLSAQGSFQQIKNYLNEQTGVRIYRDNVRVFNYGEPNDDWLGLNASRINAPKKIGTNSIIAAIELDLEKSSHLHEKTNREGFDENAAYKRLKGVVSSIMEDFILQHEDDRTNLDEYIKTGNVSKKMDPPAQFAQTINKIRKGLAKHKIEKSIGKHVDSIESEYLRMREVTMSAGMAGINLAVIFHEVEREIHALHKAVSNKEPEKLLLARSQHLTSLLEGFAPLLKRNEQKAFKISSLTERVLSLIDHRFKFHKVVLSAPVLTGEGVDFEIHAPFGLLQATLNNLLNNSIHWARWEAESKGGRVKPAVGIFTLDDWFQEGPALVVADNGQGFKIAPEEAVQPFKTTRPGGMGLGLYYANMVMETIGGRLLILPPEDLDLPEQYNGGAVVLLFDKKRGK